MKAAAAGI